MPHLWPSAAQMVSRNCFVTDNKETVRDARKTTYDAEMSVFRGQVQRSVAVGGGLVDIGAVTQQQLDQTVVALPRAVVQRTHVYNTRTVINILTCPIPSQTDSFTNTCAKTFTFVGLALAEQQLNLGRDRILNSVRWSGLYVCFLSRRL